MHDMKLPIILNILGLLLYFVLRFGNRKDKSKPVSVKFWWQDNFQELASTLIFNAVLVILMLESGIRIDLKALFPFIPDAVAFTSDLAVYFMIGALISHGAYELWKKRKSNVKA